MDRITQTEMQLAELKEQGKWILNNVKDLNHKVDHLIKFKWQVIGGSAVLSFITMIALELSRK